MKREFYVVEREESFNGGNEYNNYEDALYDLRKTLEDESSYMYNVNKNHIYTLSKVTIEDEDNYNWDTLKSISVKDFRNLDYEEKEKFFKSEV